MPDLSDLTVTQWQYRSFMKWSENKFEDDWKGEPKIPRFDQAIENQPALLNRAAMESIVGGAFVPGFEVGKISSQMTTYENPFMRKEGDYFDFRIYQKLPAGTLTKDLAIPWQTDFTACGTGWWPGGRPNYVSKNGTDFYSWVPKDTKYCQMLNLWKDLGFIKKRKIKGQTKYLEVERNVPHIPPSKT